MTNEELGRLGVACVIAMLGAIVEAQLELCPDLAMESSNAGFRKAVFWWVLMVIGCGVILDASEGSPRKTLIFASSIVATSFLGVAFFMGTVDQSEQFCFSGISKDHPALIALALMIWIATAIFSFLLSFSRPVLDKIVKSMAKEATPERIATIEKTIRAAISALATLALLLVLL